MTLADDLRAWNRANERARLAYEAEPNACADWCIECVRPVGTTRRCEHCKAALRARLWHAMRRAAK